MQVDLGVELVIVLCGRCAKFLVLCTLPRSGTITVTLPS